MRNEGTARGGEEGEKGETRVLGYKERAGALEVLAESAEPGRWGC